MARVTVEDCVLQVPNRFDLVVVAAQRARKISGGAPLTVERDRDKNPVVSLREIAERTVDLDELEEAVIVGNQKHADQDDAEDEMAAALVATPGSRNAEPQVDDLDISSMLAELRAEAGEFKTRDGS